MKQTSTLSQPSFLDWALAVAVVVLSPVLLFPEPGRLPILFLLPVVLLVRWMKTRTVLPRTPLDWAILVLAIEVAATCLFVSDLPFSLTKVTVALFGLLVFYTLVLLLRTERFIRIGINFYAAAGVVLAIVGILGVGRHSEPKYIPFLYRLLKAVPSVNFNLPGAEKGFHPNALGGGLVMIFPLCFVLLLGSWEKSGGWKRRFFFSAGFAVMGTVLLLIQSRSSFAGIYFAAWLLLFTALRKKRLAAVIVTVVMISLVVGIFRMAGSDRVPYTDLESRNKLVGRVIKFWEPALEAIHDHPVFGIGLNNARLVPTVGMEQAHFHNQFLQTAAELGLPGLVAYLAILFGAAAMCFHVWKRSASSFMRRAVLGLGGGQLALFVFGFLDAIPLGSKVGILFWISLALITSVYVFTIHTEGKTGGHDPAARKVG